MAIAKDSESAKTELILQGQLVSFALKEHAAHELALPSNVKDAPIVALAIAYQCHVLIEQSKHGTTDIETTCKHFVY